MGRAKKLSGMAAKAVSIKKSFLLLCQQYDQLGKYIRVEAEALRRGDADTAAKARECFHNQFQEVGEQLKNVGEAIDNLGGAPVFSSKEI